MRWDGEVAGFFPRLAFALAIAQIVLPPVHLVVGSHDNETKPRRFAKGTEQLDGPLARRKAIMSVKMADMADVASSDAYRHPGITPTKAIVAKLVKLARLSTAALKFQLDVTDGADVFELKTLERGECPSPSTIDWLPARPRAEAAQHFRRRGKLVSQANHSRKDGSDPPRPALLWYEHVSKAGGTSFCQLARNNMKRREVPRYYCMPSEPPIVDARVGQWSNEKLDAWQAEQKKNIVSNEWEPFPLARFEMNKELAEGNGAAPPLLLVFVTTLREPLNRLLSAYHFWGVLKTGVRNRKSLKKEKPPLLFDWLRDMKARALNDSLSAVGMGKGVGTGKDKFARVGQPNFATWKFSGGSLPVFGWPFSDQPEEAWAPSFEQAVRTLTQFDVAIPMEDLSEHPEPLQDLLGWHDFSITHVVSDGKVVNNDAHGELGTEEHLKLFDANRLDYILHSWTHAVYLARAYCVAPEGSHVQQRVKKSKVSAGAPAVPVKAQYKAPTAPIVEARRAIVPKRNRNKKTVPAGKSATER